MKVGLRAAMSQRPIAERAIYALDHSRDCHLDWRILWDDAVQVSFQIER